MDVGIIRLIQPKVHVEKHRLVVFVVCLALSKLDRVHPTLYNRD